MQPADRTPDEGLETLVASAQIDLLYRRGAMLYIASIVNAALFTFAAWGRIGHGRLLGWVATIIVVAAVRIALRNAFFSRLRSPAEALYWARAFVIGSGLNGAVWGASALLFSLPDIGLQMLLLLIICGMAAGATALSSTYLPSYFAFVVLSMVPFLVRHALAGDRFHGVLALLVAVYGGSMSLLARSTGHMTGQAVRLRLHVAALNEMLESRVAERTRQLQSALAVREEFISIASHELKTPLTSLKLQLQILEKSLRSAGTRTRVKTAGRFSIIERQTTRLTKLLNTMLDLSRLKTANIELFPQKVDLVALVRHVAGDMKEELARCGSSLTLDVGDTLPGFWDPMRCEQIVSNLLSNAAKYGAGKPITLTLEQSDGAARLVIEDHGIGIAPGDLDRIFGKFERAVPATRYGGFGLGLFVVRQLVYAMHGTIEVRSRPGEGSAFSVELPRWDVDETYSQDRKEADSAAQHPAPLG